MHKNSPHRFPGLSSSILTGLLALIWVSFNPTTSFAQLRVLTTIKPIHSLVSGVMAGIASPDLLIEGSSSPHNYNLRPSDARKLSTADVIFWVSEDIETSLTKPLKTLGSSAMVVELVHSPGLSLLETRSDTLWSTQEKNHETQHDEHHHHEEIDPHFWLDPENAVVMVREIVKKLSLADVEHARQYANNGADLITRINALTSKLKAMVSPVQATPYLVFHDGFQYFEKRFNLNAVGAITLNLNRSPGAKSLVRIRQKISSTKAACVFTEPQFKPTIVKTVIRNTTVRLGVLDPLGIDIPPGPNAYLDLLRSLAQSLVSCLGKHPK